MCADEHAGGRDLGQQSVEDGPVAPIDDWIDPDQHAVDTHELSANVVGIIIVIRRALHHHAGVGKGGSCPGKT